MNTFFHAIAKKWFPISFILLIIFCLFTRFYQVTKSPPSLYWEEMALGYDSYSVLKTGKDHLGNSPSLVAFESYGDYKPALYFYLMIPSLAMFGLNEFAVRLPAMIAGIGIVIGVGLVARLIVLLTRNEKYSKNMLETARLAQCIAMAVTILSPWAIMFSRAAWEANVATNFIVWGVVFFLLGMKDMKRSAVFVVLGLLSFGLSMYCYHSARFIAPLMSLSLFLVVFTKELGEKLFPLHIAYLIKRVRIIIKYGVLGIVFIFFLLPLLLSFRDQKVQQRLAETSIFADGHVPIESNEYREKNNYSLLSKVFFHRDVFYVKEFAENYLKHFTFQFLFVTGDHNLRHSVQHFGQMYIFEVIFVFAGVIFIFRQKKLLLWFLLFWLLIGVIPAALTDAAPHSLRTLPVMPVYMLLITFGILEASGYLKQMVFQFSYRISKIVILFFGIGITAFYIFFFIGFWHFYSTVYPKIYSGAWQYGYRQIVEEVQRRKEKFSNVYFLREMDRPAMAYWFFTQTDPKVVQPIDKQLQKDQGPELQFENIHFINFIGDARTGLVASSVWSLEQLQKKGSSVSNISEIKDPAGKTIWVVYELN